MSLSSPQNRVVVLAVLAGLALLSSACGYRPLYGETSTNTLVERQLAAVVVKPIGDRVGQMMHTELARRLNPSGARVPTTHRLSVELSEGVSHLAVERNTFATRANLVLNATYKLVRIRDDKLVDDGKDQVVASYNLLSSDYATLVAQRDARARAVTELAERLRNWAAIYFHGPGASEAIIIEETPAPDGQPPQGQP